MPRRRSQSVDSGSERGPGRPTLDPKTERVDLRLSREDVDRLDAKAKAAGVGRSEMIRALIRGLEL